MVVVVIVRGAGFPGGFCVFWGGGELRVFGGGGRAAVQVERAIFFEGGVASFRGGGISPPPKRASSTHYLSFFTISFDLRVCRR